MHIPGTNQIDAVGEITFWAFPRSNGPKNLSVGCDNKPFSKLCDLQLDDFANSIQLPSVGAGNAVVIPMLTQHYMMLQRNLLYTAITRAKKLAILVGTKKAIAIAIRNDKVTKRYTSLAKRLQDRFEQADGIEHSESQPLELFQDV